jgi:molecular chaperone GrpE
LKTYFEKKLMENSTDKETEMNKEELVSENQENQSEEKPTSENDEKSNEEVKKLQGDLSEAKDKYLRLYSEFENFRRRTAKEKLEMIQTANEQLVRTLLPVVDDFERAEKAIADGAAGKELEGFLLIQQKMKKILEQHGVKAIDLEAGADFDPDSQEAITQIPAPEEKLKGKVVDVIEKGYQLNDKLIRYAKVVVGN